VFCVKYVKLARARQASNNEPILGPILALDHANSLERPTNGPHTCRSDYQKPYTFFTSKCDHRPVPFLLKLDC
jgi:hypothetical protein